jgi:hypothetical protein
MKRSGISVYVNRLANSISRVFKAEPREAKTRYRSDVSITTSPFPRSACETDL